MISAQITLHSVQLPLFIKLLRYLARSHFSPVFCCYVGIPRILIFLFIQLLPLYLTHIITINNVIITVLYLDT